MFRGGYFAKLFPYCLKNKAEEGVLYVVAREE